MMFGLWQSSGRPMSLRRRIPCAAGLLSGLLALCTGGCESVRPLPDGLSVVVTKPFAIPSGQAHAVFQYGRPVAASDRLAPYCEFEVREVSDGAPRRVARGMFAVTRIRHRLLRDPTTRMPVMLRGTGCFAPFSRETVWRESIWTLAASSPGEALWLRCLAPYDGCTSAPPLAPAQVQRQVGSYLRVHAQSLDVGW